MPKSRNKELKKWAYSWGLELDNYFLLNKAFTHPTYVFENKKKKLESNQRLEFLGDAVLGMIVAHYLFDNFPDYSEGELTKLRAAVVCEPALADAARKLDLGKYLLLGKGEEMTEGRSRNSNLADAFEALVGALFLEIGLQKTSNFVISLMKNEIIRANKETYKDFKTILQEKVQELYSDNVEYKILSEKGPDHDKTFFVGVYFQDELLAKGSGKNKKEAEQKAAEKALELIAGDHSE